MRNYTVKKNPIGSGVSKILRYTHTHTDIHIEILLAYYKDYTFKIKYILRGLISVK